MGFRYRKSINIGGLRINASKSGLGASVGVKGLRVTKRVDGRTELTASIPGTGVSYQETLSKEKRRNEYINRQKKEKKENNYKSVDIVDAPKLYSEYNSNLSANADMSEYFITFGGKLASRFTSGIKDKENSDIVCSIIIYSHTFVVNFQIHSLIFKCEIENVHVKKVITNKKFLFKKWTEISLEFVIDIVPTEKLEVIVVDEIIADRVIRQIQEIKDRIVLNKNKQQEEVSTFELEDFQLPQTVIRESRYLTENEPVLEATIFKISEYNASKVALTAKVQKGTINVGDEVLLIGEIKGQKIRMDAVITDLIQNMCFVEFVDSEDGDVSLLIENNLEDVDFLESGGYLRNLIY
ncbi:DUF4236 domain-containing protein [Paenibacillus sp. Soil750]|uniref:DUF4236 domain-containing protein n=1 Tax=Paenibacillus sp. Soil750 TaxID=1736398 RepID=UPI0007C7C404|nr:DUF4236 domain-containing protein [Paenibacillus sp. Soil750]